MCFGWQQCFSQSLTNSETMKTEEASPVRNSRSAKRKQSRGEHGTAGFWAGEGSLIKGPPAVGICVGVTM